MQVWRRKISSWLKEHPCQAVILAGLAGALDPAWDEGDVTSFHAEDWEPFHRWCGSQARVRGGQWHTAHEIIATGEAKIALGKKTGCGIVEMEWDYVTQACQMHKTPLVGLRAVSDHADKLLPADLFLLGCDAVTGKSTPGKIRPSSRPPSVALGGVTAGGGGMYSCPQPSVASAGGVFGLSESGKILPFEVTPLLSDGFGCLEARDDGALDRGGEAGFRPIAGQKQILH